MDQLLYNALMQRRAPRSSLRDHRPVLPPVDTVREVLESRLEAALRWYVHRSSLDGPTLHAMQFDASRVAREVWAEFELLDAAPSVIVNMRSPTEVTVGITYSNRRGSHAPA